MVAEAKAVRFWIDGKPAGFADVELPKTHSDQPRLILHRGKVEVSLNLKMTRVNWVALWSLMALAAEGNGVPE